MNRKRGLKGSVVIIFALFFITMFFLINGKPFGLMSFKEATHGVNILDMEKNYSPQQAYILLDSLKETGRKLYINLLLYFDFLFPLSYTLFYCSFVIYFLSKVFPNVNRIKLIGFMPILAGLSDFCENIFELIMLYNYPRKLYSIAKLANFANSCKYIFITLSASLMLISLLLFLGKLFYNRTKKATG